MDLQEVQRLIGSGDYEFSFHAQQERLEEDLDIAQIEAALTGNAEVLERYPNDPRGESCLMLGFAGGQPIHVVLGWSERRRSASRILRVITVYKPALPKWICPRTRGGSS